MKLIHRVTLNLSVVLSIILAIWAILFYITIIEEVNDEIDDSLDDYSEQIIIRMLAGEELALTTNNTNNEYYVTEVSKAYAMSQPSMTYTDSMIYIPLKKETEPARILTTIFRNGDGRYFKLVVATPTIEKKDLKEAILYWVIFLYISLLLIIILVNVFIYKKSYKPFYKLLLWLDKYKVGNDNEPLNNPTNILEFKKLNEVVLRTMHRAEQAFELQKQFTGNASHEIQTPLAVCRNRIENLMEEEGITEHQLDELSKTYQTLVYITKLNKTLLLLAKIENGQFFEKKEITINDSLINILTDYQEVYSYMKITTNIVEKGIWKLNMNETLTQIMLNNLLKNSYIHNIKNGSIDIELHSNSIIFKNTGQIGTLDKEFIFQRFSKGDNHEESSGLGLSLVKAICDIENLKIEYYYKDDYHHFKIQQL